ncbi:hypothetical protein JVT61DRAFT_514 [Boletus reticuloceps]|uniref:Uncharacterized protein n=1 Tax=Boletus reticuloceps TaxID=495285 RepID=A0A8I2Z1T0_9AGAM|nr:hypothetical protein JVT61DRAFT_514 [Boletus reticuloceps]
MVVLSAYEQIRATRFDVLNDVDEDGYERAFTSIRPGSMSVLTGALVIDWFLLVIQGASDIGKRLSEQELQNALDFCSKFFHPTSPEQRAHALQCGLPDNLFDVSMEPADPKEIDVTLGMTGAGVGLWDAEPTQVHSVRMVMEQANARRVVHREYLVNNLQAEEIDGYVVRLQRGSLGLSRVG